MKLTTLDKSLQVIDLLSKNPQGLSLLEMSTMIGFPKSTIHHILATFLPYDYVSQNKETKKYSLGLKFLSISKVILDNIDVRKIARKYLFELRDECRERHSDFSEAIHLAILRSGKVIYIDKIDSQGGLSLATYIGFRTDPHAAAGGKVLLSELSPKEIVEIYPGRVLKRYGKNTITNIDDLFKELEKIRGQGYAIDDEEYYEGVRCIAAPIRAGGRIVAALSVTGSIFTMSMERIEGELKELVINKAERISSEMEW
ncbi:MAG: IclR family transcriptional regulator [Deltaproteobacteria bacterium]|nr:IclR family transcriptional regulator [Deltaproteobacteria bacterium]MBW1976714.1 IclR family transcriptional regulator [Deltaproteobacteria bacterium]MBW2044821.1 IclR family transcriptional regulator [Deltaproteobacteria bacterium]MBW2300485.1 IclR family transcriptional regulator [Deltaproteobacteria bacterium]